MLKVINKFFQKFSFLGDILLILGCLNMGSIGLFGIDFLNAIFYSNPIFLNTLYTSIGLVGFNGLISFYKDMRLKMDK